MMELIEKELKYQLIKKDYYIFKDFLNCKGIKSSTKLHINYYLDSKDLILKKNGITARFRINDESKCKLTVKSKMNGSMGNIHIKKETSLDIEYLRFCKIRDEGDLNNCPDLYGFIIKDLIDTDQIKPIRILGQLQTERSNYILGKNIDEVTLDKSQYLDVEDYEIEWETEKLKRAENKLTTIFSKLNINPINNTDSKNDRFVKEYLKKFNNFTY